MGFFGKAKKEFKKMTHGSQDVSPGFATVVQEQNEDPENYVAES